MYLSTSHPGINTSPQPQLQEDTPKSKRFPENADRQIPKLHYDGDVESDLVDNEDVDPSQDEFEEGSTALFSGSELLYQRYQASSLPDLVGIVSSLSMSTSNYSIHQELLGEGEGTQGVNANYLVVDGNLSVAATPTRRKKRKKRRSESEIESPSKIRGGGSPLTIVAKSKSSGKSGSSSGPSFLASTPIQPLPQLVEIPPLRAHWDLGNSIGRRRGVSGYNSVTADTSYLDVTLFTLFYFSDQFDDWILDEKSSKGFPTVGSKNVRSLLRKEILYSLRTAYFCPSSSVGRLTKSLFPDSQPYTLEFSRFLHYFLDKVLNLPETTHYTTGSSKLIHRLTTITAGSGSTVQLIFEQSLGDMKLLSLPQPGLFLSVENPLVVPHPVLLPNIQLDLSRTLIQLSTDDNDTTTDGNNGSGRYKVNKNAAKTQNKNQDTSGTQSDTHFSTETKLCKWFRSVCKVIYEYLQNLVEQLPTTYGVENSSHFNQSVISNLNDSTSIDDSWSVVAPRSTQNNDDMDDDEAFLISAGEDRKMAKRRKGNKGKLTLALDLMAVICLQHCPTSYQNRYTAFVRCGQNPRRGWAPWAHFSPSDQHGGTPLVRRVEDLGKWLNRLEKRPGKMKSLWNVIPSDVKNLLTNSTFFIYTPKPDYESQNTLFSYVNEC